MEVMSPGLKSWIEGYHDGVKELNGYIRLLLKTARLDPDLFSEELAGIEFIADKTKNWEDLMIFIDKENSTKEIPDDN